MVAVTTTTRMDRLIPFEAMGGQLFHRAGLLCWLATLTAASQLSITVTNHLSEPVDVYWVPAVGSKSGNVFQDSIKPGETMQRNTYPGHTFLAQSQGKSLRKLKQFTVTDGLHTVHLNDDGSHQCAAFANDEKPPRPPCRDHPKAARQCNQRGPGGAGCGSAPGWNIHFCPKTCDKALNACELHDPNLRCNRTRLFNENNVTLKPGFEPNSGELAELFNTIEAKWAHLGARLILQDPPIAVFNNFMTEEEAVALRTASGDNAFKRSTASGTTDASGYTTQVTSKVRTSQNAWCMGSCQKNPTVQAVTNRIEEVTTVDQGNFESFQLLRYETGQYYNRHHDYSGPDPTKVMPAGPRILTFFLYLSDVPSGGETEFPDLEPPVKFIKAQSGSGCALAFSVG